jgi:cytochrome P450
MRKYTSQGVKQVYVPLIGAFKFFHPQLKVPHEDPSEVCTTFS